MIRSWLVLSSHPRVNYSGERGAAMWGLCIVAEMLLNGGSYTKMICGGALCKMICFGFDDSWNAVVVFKTHVSTSLPGSTCWSTMGDIGHDMWRGELLMQFCRERGRRKWLTSMQGSFGKNMACLQPTCVKPFSDDKFHGCMHCQLRCATRAGEGAHFFMGSSFAFSLWLHAVFCLLGWIP